METGVISCATLQTTALKDCSYNKMRRLFSTCSFLFRRNWDRRLGLDGSNFGLGTEVVVDRGLPLTWESKPKQSAGKAIFFKCWLNDMPEVPYSPVELLSLTHTHPCNSSFVRTFCEIIQPAKMSSLQVWIPHCVACTNTHLHKQCLSLTALTCQCGPEFNTSPHCMWALQCAWPRRALVRRSSETTQGGRCKWTVQVRSEWRRQRALWGAANGASKHWDWGFHQ